MSQENVDALRAVYEEWGRGNFRAGVDLYDSQVRYVPLADLPDVEHRSLVGPEGIREYMRGQLQAWTQLTIAADEFIDVGDEVIVAALWRGVGKGGLASVEWRGFHVWTFQERVVTRLALLPTRSEALEAVGLGR